MTTVKKQYFFQLFNNILQGFFTDKIDKSFYELFNQRAHSSLDRKKKHQITTIVFEP